MKEKIEMIRKTHASEAMKTILLFLVLEDENIIPQLPEEIRKELYKTIIAVLSSEEIMFNDEVSKLCSKLDLSSEPVEITPARPAGGIIY